MPDEDGNPTMEELQAQLQQLQQANAQANQVIWRQKAVEAHPTLKDLSDLIQGDSEETVLANAKALAQRFSQSFPPPPAGEPAKPPEPSAQQLYGEPGSGGNGTPLQQRDPVLELENRVRGNMPRGAETSQPNTNVGRGEAKISKRDAKLFQDLFFQRFGRDMLISHGKMRPAAGERWRNTETGELHTG